MTRRRAVAPRPKPAPRRTAPTCEIALWRGYVKAGFYARAFEPDGEEVAVAESPLFRIRGKGMPDRDGKALAAFETLRGRLQEQGWNSVGRGQHWFSERFERPLPGPHA